MRANIPRLVTAYYTRRPDPEDPSQRVVFGTSGHRGSSLKDSFNEHHILAITRAICEQRRAAGVDGPLFIGMDTHGLSEPAFATALEVLERQSVDLIISDWNMPKMTGLELLKSVRASDQYKKTPFLMVTAEAQKQNVIEAVQAGVSNYVVKPCTAEAISEKLTKILK